MSKLKVHYVVLFDDYAITGVTYIKEFKTPMYRNACAFIKNCLNDDIAVYAVSKEIVKEN
jgi:hypothetical protein